MGGRLFRVELARHRVDYSVQAPTAPVALVATSTRVWVAGAHADRGGGQAFADSVLEYDVGKPSIMHSYLVSAPSGLAAAGDEAWVTHGDSAKTRGISRLKAGRASVFAPLPGQPAGTGAAPAVSICSGQLAVVVTSERPAGPGAARAGPARRLDVRRLRELRAPDREGATAGVPAGDTMCGMQAAGRASLSGPDPGRAGSVRPRRGACSSAGRPRPG